MKPRTRKVDTPVIGRVLPVILTISASLTSLIEAAPLRDIPCTIEQPDGRIIHCFVSGDEYYHRPHDEHGYTIVKDPATGYAVYAERSVDEVVPSSFIVGVTDPVGTHLEPNVVISKEEYLRRRRAYHAGERDPEAPHAGDIDHLMVFIRFNDQTEFPNPRSFYDTRFNSAAPGDNSVVNYYEEVSYDQLTITTTFYPTCAPTTNLSYQDAHDRGYYSPFDPIDNPGGYANDIVRREREHTLIRDAVQFIASEVPASLDIDADSDGEVDMISFMIRGGADPWGELLWPHASALTTYSVYILGSLVYNYTFEIENMSGVGAQCHEMFHVLGAPDLYHYDTLWRPYKSVGKWDLMDLTRDPPQHMGAYMKERYGEWISSILQIPQLGGVYYLNPLTSSSGQAFRAPSSASPSEYFIFEYRRGAGTFEANLPDSGLLVYRIDTSQDGQGNAQGPPDEVYIYRPGGTTTENGSPDSANFSVDVYRVAINNLSDPPGFLHDGSAGNLFVADVGSVGSQIDFFYSPIYYERSGGVADGFGGPLIPSADGYPYFFVGDVITPIGNALTVLNGTRVYGQPGTTMRGDGTIFFPAGDQWTRVFSLGGYRRGIKSKGEIKMMNGGMISFD